MMEKKPDNEEWKQRIKELEKEVIQLRLEKNEITSLKERLKILFEFAPDGYFLCDLKGRFIDGNKTAERLSGYKKEELIGKNFLKLNLLSPKQIKKAAMILAKIAIGHPIGPAEFSLNRKDGSQVELEIRTFSLKVNGKTTILAIARDITKRKRADEALRRSDQKFRSIFEHMAAASCFDEIVYEDGKPVDYRIIDVNPSYERIIGISKSVAVGALASKLYGTGEAPFLDVYSKVAKTGQSASFEAYFPPSEKHLHILVSCPGRGHFFTVFSDITERKRNEKLLQESEQRYRTLFESSRDAIMLINLKGKVLQGNPAAIKLFGCVDNEEFTSQSVIGLSPEYQPDGTLSLVKAEQEIKIALEKGSHFFEWKHKRKDGKEFFTSVLLTKMELDHELIIQAMVRDITENKVTEESLKKFKTIAEEQAIGNAIADIEGNLIYTNKAFAQMHGYNDKELIGKNLSIFLVEEQRGKKTIVHNVKKWLETISKFVSKEVWRVRKDGSVFPSLMNVAVIKDAKEEPLFFAESVNDISIRKNAEETLKKREQELEIKTNRLEEINTALNVLLQKRDEDKKRLEDGVLFNMRRMIEPYVEKLKNSMLDEKQKLYVGILERNLNDIISTFPQAASSKYLKLTPMELEVANLVRQGKSTKEIAMGLDISYKTAQFHRENIRKKFNLKNRKDNLRTHLLSFP